MKNDSEKIIEALGGVGIYITNVYDLVNSKEDYAKAIPILLEFIEKEKIGDLKVKEGIIRALAVKEAKGKAGKILLEEFNRLGKENGFVKWAIGSTIEVVIAPNDVDYVIPIVIDKNNGISRQMFVSALGKVKDSKVEQVLIKLLDDTDVSAFAIGALAKQKNSKNIEVIKNYIGSKNKLVSKEATKAVNKLSKL